MSIVSSCHLFSKPHTIFIISNTLVKSHQVMFVFVQYKIFEINYYFRLIYVIFVKYRKLLSDAQISCFFCLCSSLFTGQMKFEEKCIILQCTLFILFVQIVYLEKYVHPCKISKYVSKCFVKLWPTHPAFQLLVHLFIRYQSCVLYHLAFNKCFL